MTAVAYAAGLYLVYLLSLRISGSRRLALYAFVSVVLLHPLAIYPWSNYVAFPFIVGGCLATLNMECRPMKALLAGVLLGLAVLCREGLAPAIFAFCGVLSCIRFIEARPMNEKPTMVVATLWAGLLLPIAVFFIFIWSSNIYEYWYTTSVSLPRLYAGVFLKDGVLRGFMNLGLYFMTGFVGRGARILFLGLMVVFSCFTVVGYFLCKKRFNINSGLFLVSVISLLLLSASFHLNEIFRLATGTGLGVVIVYIYADKFRVGLLIFIIFSLGFVVNLAGRNEGNYFYPTKKQRVEGVSAPNELSIFAGQKWPVSRYDFYRMFQQDMLLLRQDKCHIQYYANDTTDVFLAILSKFDQYQLAPFGRGRYEIAGWDALRPEFDVGKRVREQQDIVLFVEQDRHSNHALDVPTGYVLAKQYLMPEITFRPAGNTVSIMVPKSCRFFINATASSGPGKS